MATREWDAATYDRVSDPQVRWGQAVLERLQAPADAVVLDAGCGTGRVTELLVQQVPRGRVVAVDASRRMLAKAAERLAAYGDRVRFVVADLARPLAGVGPVDAVVSTATFHWITDHDALFANLAAVLRPGGRLVAQCGGAGNVARISAAVAEVGDGWAGPWHFATAEQSAARLHKSGFAPVSAWLEDQPVRFRKREEFTEYLATVVLGAHLDRLAPQARPGFVEAVTTRLPELVVDYVRLNLVATRATEPL
ncbi:MAG: class I SAM-dependent methyltransferase [Actinomycetota bacterium]|nr:class I SAM-dependent methyltransferase [Actinomycetota bacterium]